MINSTTFNYPAQGDTLPDSNGVREVAKSTFRRCRSRVSRLTRRARGSNPTTLVVRVAITMAVLLSGSSAYAQDQDPGPGPELFETASDDAGRNQVAGDGEPGAGVEDRADSVSDTGAADGDNEIPLLSITAVSAEVAEGQDAVFRITRQRSRSGVLVVGLYVEGHRKMMTSETENIAFDPPNDGTAGDTTVVFGRDEGEVLVVLTTDDDNVNEGDGLLAVRIARSALLYEVAGADTAEVLVRDDDIPTVSIGMPELPSGMTLSESGDTWEGSQIEGQEISFTLACSGDYEYTPSPNIMRTYFTWIAEMNHPGFFSKSAVDLGIIGNNQTGFSQIGNCDSRTVPDPMGARRRFVGPDGGEVRIDIVPANVEFSQTLRDLKLEYQAAREEAKRLGVPLTAPGLFVGVQDTFPFHCDDELKFCPRYEIGSPSSIRVEVVNRDPVILIAAEADEVSEGQPARFVLERVWNEENLSASSPGWADTLVLLRTTVHGHQTTGELPTEFTFGRNETETVIEVATGKVQAFGDDGSVTIEILPDTTGPDQNLAAKYTTAETWLGHTRPGSRSDRATVTVMGDDSAVLVGFGAGAYEVGEGSDVTVTVSLSADPGGEVVIPLSVENLGGVSVADYSGVPESVTFVSGQTEQTFVFAAAQDAVDDDGESVVLGFGTLPAGVMAGTVGTATVSLVDDDVAAVMVSPPSVQLSEGESTTYMVLLATQPSGAVTIVLNDPSNTDITVEPESLTFTADNWDEAQMVTVYADQDSDPMDETDEVTHEVSGGGYDTVDTDPVAVTVLDDDSVSDCGDVWCATVEFADQSATDWGLYRLFYHRSSEPPSSLSHPEFVYEGRVHTITNMYLSPGIPPDSDAAPTGIETEQSTFFISILPGKWGQVPDTGVPEADYLNWTLHIGEVELPFRDSHGPTRSDGRRGTFVWSGSAIQGLFSEWPVPTTFQVRIEETPHREHEVGAARAPSAPLYLRVAPLNADSLLVVWRAPASDGGSGVTSYRVQWKEDGEAWDDPDAVSEIQVGASDGSKNTENISGLTRGVDYTVRVIATNDIGDSSPSEEYPGRPQAHTRSITGATVDGASLMVKFNRLLDSNSVPPSDAFEVLVNGGLRSVTGVAVRGDTVGLSLSQSVSPADEVHVRYLPPTDLTDPSSIRDTDGNLAIDLGMFDYADVGNETDRATLQPLTARFVDTPDSHNGSGSFTFRVEFSESVWVERGDTRADVLEVSGGSVTRGWWLDRHTGLWEFTVQPDSNGDVTIVLPTNRACGTVGAPCASGDRRLTNRLELTVRGPDS